MSVNSYLEDVAKKLILSNEEENKINNSIAYFKYNMQRYFGNSIIEIREFGSYERKTNLPRKVDSNSDVDIMIVFDDDGSTPQTYLNRIRRAVELYYSSSDIKQSSPTIVLEMNHIKFEITPAIKKYGLYYIKNEDSWKETDCLKDRDNLIKVNKQNNYKIKPIIRLIKYWNVSKNYKWISSYIIEKSIVNKFDWYNWGCINYIDYLIKSFECVKENVNQKTYKDRIDIALNTLINAKNQERDYPLSALMKIESVIGNL